MTGRQWKSPWSLRAKKGLGFDWSVDWSNSRATPSDKECQRPGSTGSFFPMNDSRPWNPPFIPDIPTSLFSESKEIKRSSALKELMHSTKLGYDRSFNNNHSNYYYRNQPHRPRIFILNIPFHLISSPFLLTPLKTLEDSFFIWLCKS